MTFLPQPEAPGPNPGQPGHYADHEWITLALNALDDALSGMGGGGYLGGFGYGGAFGAIGDFTVPASVPFTLATDRLIHAHVVLFGRSASAGNGINCLVKDMARDTFDQFTHLWPPSSFPSHADLSIYQNLVAGSHEFTLQLQGYGANDSEMSFCYLHIFDVGPADVALGAMDKVEVEMPSTEEAG